MLEATIYSHFKVNPGLNKNIILLEHEGIFQNYKFFWWLHWFVKCHHSTKTTLTLKVFILW